MSDATGRNKLLDDFRQWLDHFRAIAKENYSVDVQYIDRATDKLNTIFWNSLEKKVTVHLEHQLDMLVDRHKIASLIEMCIMYVLPVKHDNLETRAEYNASLATVVAKTILIKWKKLDLDENLFHRMTPSFNREHRSWLKKAHLEHFPVFSNACTWYAMESFCHFGGRAWAARDTGQPY